jgi:SAM-dependent methyltransferase
MPGAPEPGSAEPLAAALARLYDLDLAEDLGDVDLYLALAGRAGDPMVELCVGSGRIALPLVEAGHHVVGIDRDRAMLDRARRASGPATSAHGAGAADATGRTRAGRLELVEADVLEPRAEDVGRFGLAILGLNSLLLFDHRGVQEQVIRTMARLVAPGGIVVVDAWQPQPFDLVRLDGRVSLEWLRHDPETGREVTKLASGWYDPATRTVALTTIFEESAPGGAVARWTRTDRMRLASAEELEGWAETAGLDVEQLAGDYELNPFGAASERAILVARRPA